MDITITQVFLIITGLIAFGIALIFATNFHSGSLSNIFSMLGLGFP